MAWQHNSPEVIRVLESAVCPMQWMGMMIIHCEEAVNRMGMLGGSVGKTKELTLKMETVTLTCKDGWNMACFVY